MYVWGPGSSLSLSLSLSHCMLGMLVCVMKVNFSSFQLICFCNIEIGSSQVVLSGLSGNWKQSVCVYVCIGSQKFCTRLNILATAPLSWETFFSFHGVFWTPFRGSPALGWRFVVVCVLLWRPHFALVTGKPNLCAHKARFCFHLTKNRWPGALSAKLYSHQLSSLLPEELDWRV